MRAYSRNAAFIVRVYPDPNDEPLEWTEIFEVIDTATDLEVVSDAEVRDHPEVPLGDDARDRVLQRLMFRRRGEWRQDGKAAEADVVPIDQET
jgi:hypothetical protein